MCHYKKKKSNDKLYEQYMIFGENSNKLRLVENLYYLPKKIEQMKCLSSI